MLDRYQAFFAFEGYTDLKMKGPLPAVGYYQLDNSNTSNAVIKVKKKKKHTNSSSSKRKKGIGLASLVVLIYYCVSGGPFGIEDIVRAGGPFFALLGFALILVWAIPEALITAELSTAMPEASGSVAWVEEAYGKWWAFQKGWLSWLSGVSDNALYPILFLDCLLELMTSSDGTSPLDNDTGYIRWAFIITITICLTYLNYRGLDVVGNVAIVICLISLLPFVVFCVLGSFQVVPSRWLTTPANGIYGVDWRLLLNTFFWNINYWESASSFSGDVDNPGRNYPLAMGVAVLMVFLSLFLPVLIGTGASSEAYTEWTGKVMNDIDVTDRNRVVEREGAASFEFLYNGWCLCVCVCVILRVVCMRVRVALRARPPALPVCSAVPYLPSLPRFLINNVHIRRVLRPLGVCDCGAMARILDDVRGGHV